MIKRKCTCTYNKLIKQGYKPTDHAWSCPLNESYHKSEAHRYRFHEIKENNLGVSPFKEEWLNEEEHKRYNERIERTYDRQKGRFKKREEM